ncbi:DUF3426 domain-containing protein [Moraxella lacunata]|uniref:Zinc finger/thioredoxin putative domain-containing protein n=1 Tax=Moraxella lacunata TaxID=477 RepID=A0A1V4GTM2_MORLA|nr:DUF3426 domain-containing protein [Moraxella lacunata]OPH35758.1 hypothetical protein B5J94_08850 [Moraxella lacunata]
MSNQTKCPHCQTTYPMPTAKLGDPNARAKCGKCQQVFFLNANLVSSSPAAQAQRQATPDPQPAQTAQTVARPTPKRTKRVKPAPTEGMIHDEMDGVEENKPKAVSGVSFSDDELDSFLKDNISFAPTVAKSTKDEMADSEGGESWADDLLKDTKPVSTAQTTNTNSTTNNVDLDAIIPVATPKPKKPTSIKEIQPNKPTAQQLASKKSLGSQLLWLVGCLLLVGLLAVQYALFNVDKLAKNPETASLAHTVCGVVPCNIPSADLNGLEVTSSLENQKDVIIDITNKTSSEQLFPYLLVQFKDGNGVVVADFVADTKDYLGESQTTLLANQHKRVMLSANSAPKASSVTVTPFYQ